MSHGYDGAREALLQGSGTVVKRVKSIWTGFLDFVARDNVLEVAVGLVIASAFTALVKSLVADILLPPISLLPFMSHKNLPNKFAVLRGGKNGTHYNTLEQAQEDGAVTMAYGIFIENVVNFIGLGLVLYTVATAYGALTHESIIKHTIKCGYCRKEISAKAKRCPMCTSWLDGREERETSAL